MVEASASETNASADSRCDPSGDAARSVSLSMLVAQEQTARDAQIEVMFKLSEHELRVMLKEGSEDRGEMVLGFGTQTREKLNPLLARGRYTEVGAVSLSLRGIGFVEPFEVQQHPSLQQAATAFLTKIHSGQSEVISVGAGAPFLRFTARDQEVQVTSRTESRYATNWVRYHFRRIDIPAELRPVRNTLQGLLLALEGQLDLVPDDKVAEEDRATGLTAIDFVGEEFWQRQNNFSLRWREELGIDYPEREFRQRYLAAYPEEGKLLIDAVTGYWRQREQAIASSLPPPTRDEDMLTRLGNAYDTVAREMVSFNDRGVLYFERGPSQAEFSLVFAEDYLTK